MPRIPRDNRTDDSQTDRRETDILRRDSSVLEALFGLGVRHDERILVGELLFEGVQKDVRESSER